MPEYTNVEHFFSNNLTAGKFHRKIVFLQHLKKNIKHTRYEQDKDKELRADP